MTAQEVVDLMQSSATEAEWNNNCDKVTAAFDGRLPDFWYRAIIQSQLMAHVIELIRSNQTGAKS
jgi:hypothetical protein